MKNTIITTLALATLLTTTFMTSNAAAAEQCGARVTVSGIKAIGAFKRGRERRGTRKAKRAWTAYIEGQAGPSIFSNFTSTSSPSFNLGSRFSNLSNAKNVIINCHGGGKGLSYCTVAATPCAK